MNEFLLINTYFQSAPSHRSDVILGIGDDAACLSVPEGMQLLVSCDTLVSGVHFLPSWDAYDIACRAVRVNVSDIAAMGGEPSWVTLALTLPDSNESWISRFSQGLCDSLTQYQMALVGGDTTQGPLSITITIHGFVPNGRAIRRDGARVGDKIYISGALGGAALAVSDLTTGCLTAADRAVLMKALLYPNPRVDLRDILRSFATAAIDISDGLSADLGHICEQSQVGACLLLDAIPLHPVLATYDANNALDFAWRGGDDYELCFTVSPDQEALFLLRLAEEGLCCFCIGTIEAEPGLRALSGDGVIHSVRAEGYTHF